MNTKEEKITVRLHLSEEERAKLKHDAALCGLSQAEYMRQICLGRTPRPQPPEVFWELMQALYELHHLFEQLTVRFPEAIEEQRRIERMVLFLQEVA